MGKKSFLEVFECLENFRIFGEKIDICENLGFFENFSVFGHFFDKKKLYFLIFGKLMEFLDIFGFLIIFLFWKNIDFFVVLEKKIVFKKILFFIFLDV